MFYKILALSLSLSFIVSSAEAQVESIHYPHLGNAVNRNPLDPRRPRNSAQEETTVNEHDEKDSSSQQELTNTESND